MAAVSGNKSHVLAVAGPGQGHVKPLMSLCRQIAKHGIKVTLVNAQSIDDKILSSAKMSPEGEMEDDDGIVLASVPDGLGPDDDPNDPFVLVRTLRRSMLETLPELIEKINISNPTQKISCVIGDLSFGRVFDIAEKMGAEAVCFCPASMASFAIILLIPKLIQQGYLDTNGSLEKIDEIKLSDEIPGWRKDKFPWSFASDLNSQKMFFECVKDCEAANKIKWLLCNSSYELEPAVSELNPNFLSIGPLHLVEAKSKKSHSDSSNFYPQDASCLTLLDAKPLESVVYVSFGSTGVCSQQQLDELALGLELSGRAFLWVVRRDLVNGSRAVFPDGFLERVSELGKIVEWAPQNRVLAHPSVGCFMSHCGWNSILEGVSEGLPYLCWPYFGDQSHDEKYICDKWEIGLRIDCDETGIRSRYEIKRKIDMLLSDNKFKENAIKLKEMCAKSVSEGGSSYKNLETFIDYVRKCSM